MQYLVTGIILILALIAIRVSNKHGIPALLLFIVLGMGFGALGIQFNDYEFSDGFATVALMVIMFYGGFGTRWKMARPVAKEAIVLSSLGVLATAVITGLFCHFVLGLSLLEGLLIGSIVGSTDFASVSNILRSKNLNLKYSTAPMLELESGSNDPTAYTMTMVFLSLIIGSDVSIPLLIISQIAIGLGLGAVFALSMGYLFRSMRIRADGLYAVFMAAAILVTFATTGLLGGNGFLALYILGIYLGNMEFHGKREIVFFFDGFTEIMQIGLFFILGLLSDFSSFLAAFPMALGIMLFMTLIARPLTVYGLMLPFGLKKNQLNILSLAGIRGAAAIAFAIMAVNSGASVSVDIYHIVFGVCLLSSLIQGSLMPVAAKRWAMLDPNDTVLQTFNYYQDKAQIGFLETRIEPGSSLIGTRVRDLNLTFDFIVAKIDRGGQTIIPRGDTIIREGDLIILGGETHFDESGQELIEFSIPHGHQWQNRRIQDLNDLEHRLIIMVQRQGAHIIVPDGETVLQEDDKVLMIEVNHKNHSQKKEGRTSGLSRLRNNLMNRK
ncbi:potassium/proton antiporter [Proteiniclasticum sp. QWL-01]|uniref:potassium/proton antiporter n=1 Tax=Proteiniclasticum sp. QWL-01 TaxID=3036945 RepID=UPI002208B5F3|nr:potassium/proton antiporter [Proteiniclasticum sp. QWL-01]UUM10893.1 potassium/proton antiporter [Clostridiaceae bacterium HFYG-1003]WFF72234.1 potassium/proton antiporter [Proteiniclasticum sp. QWL-01]